MSTAAREPNRPDFVRSSDYTSVEFAQLEAEKLWPAVWLMAAREEQFQRAGDFVRFDIAGEPIVLVRKNDGTIAAFYNVCRHRGRLLVDDLHGNLGARFFCRYHAWSYDLDGKPVYIRNRDDWDECSSFTDDDMSLKGLRVECWGGWVWVTMSPDIEPLLDYLAPVANHLAPFELDRCRAAWAVTVRVKCNWKAALEAFNEAYHVEGTHAQLNKYGALAKAPAYDVGKHTSIRIDRGKSTRRTEADAPADMPDPRQIILANAREMSSMLKALYTGPYIRAAERLAAEQLQSENLAAEFKRLHREEMESSGARWPENLTDEHIAEFGDTFHLFPNAVFLVNYNGALCYRARPDSLNPGSCYFDIWSLCRYAPGQEPEFDHTFFPDVQSFKGTNPFLDQDFGNLERVQEGMQSRSFNAARTNPSQERAISHLHEMIDSYLYD